MLQGRSLCGKVRDHFSCKCRSYTDISKELTQHPGDTSKNLILAGHSTLHTVFLGAGAVPWWAQIAHSGNSLQIKSCLRILVISEVFVSLGA